MAQWDKKPSEKSCNGLQQRHMRGGQLLFKLSYAVDSEMTENEVCLVKDNVTGTKLQAAEDDADNDLSNDKDKEEEEN